MRFDVTVAAGSDPEYQLDGVPHTGEGLRWAESEDLPHGLVYLNENRLYDAEVWVNGDCHMVVPKKSVSSESVYEAHESGFRRDEEEHAPFRREGSKTENLRRIRIAMEASAGYRAQAEWKALGRTYNVYLRNHHTLSDYVHQVESDPRVAIEMIQNVAPPVAREEILSILDQHLHNFVAAAATLVDHTRRIMRSYEGTSFRSRYEVRKNLIAEDPVVCFVRDFRNFILHRTLPFVGHTVIHTAGLEADGLRATLRISTSELLSWRKWSAPARAHIRATGEYLTLPTVIDAHKLRIGGLYEWFFRQFRGIHGADTFWLNELIGEYNWELSGGRQGRPRTSVLVPPE